MMNKSFAATVKCLALGILAVAVLACAPAGARAQTITSDGTAADPDEVNGSGPTITIAPHPDWAPALPGSSWVSYGITGNPAAPGFFVVPNNTIVSFFDSFTISNAADVVAASLTVRADDSAAVFLNNTLIAPEAASAGNTYETCSDFAIGCRVATQRTFTFAEFGGLLVSGVNTFRFDVAQRALVSFGLNYAGSITTAPPPPGIPEPATMLLLGTGLAGAAGAARRRRVRARRSE